VLTLDTPGQPWLANYPAPVHTIGPGKFAAFNYSKQLRQWLLNKGREFDVIVGHGLWQYPGWLVSSIAKRLGIPYFVFVHGQLDPWFKQAYPLKHLKKALYWHLIEYGNLKRATAVLFTTEEERVLAQQTFAMPSLNAKVVQYGVRSPEKPKGSPGDFLFAKYPELRGRRLLLFLSRLYPKKGCDVLIESFAKVAKSRPGLHLIMAGPDDNGYKAKLEALAEQFQITDRITWTGMLIGELKLDTMLTSEALVLPSHSENFGVVVAEALACRLPVLISNKVNIWREIVADGAGLVSDDAVPAFTSLMESWLAMAQSDQGAMRERAAQSFMSRFEIEASVHSYLAILQAADSKKQHSQSQYITSVATKEKSESR
jgi:glycosyltransferase involved in cell wall biosynthesis